jgi:hypothetical protein
MNDETLVEAIEQRLLARWHQEQCACPAFPGDCVTYSDGWRFTAPVTWTVEAVLEAANETKDAWFAVFLPGAGNETDFAVAARDPINGELVGCAPSMETAVRVAALHNGNAPR